MSVETLLESARALQPDLKWQLSTMYSRPETEINAHMPDGRWIRVSESDKVPTIRVKISRLVLQRPVEDGETSVHGDLVYFYTTREWRDDDLAVALISAVADMLEPQTILGLEIYPDDSLGGRPSWADITGRYTFTPSYRGGWEWHLLGRVPQMLNQLLSGGHVGGEEPTLPEAVAAALAAPARIGALLTVIAQDYATPPRLPTWTYAGQVVAKDGERVVVGPSDCLMALKEQMRAVEGPFIGRMNTDESFIVAVRDGAGLDAEGVLDHPDARRFKRY